MPQINITKDIKYVFADCTKKCTAADYEFKRCTDVDDRECRGRSITNDTQDL